MRQVGVLLAAGKSERFLYKNILKQFIEVYKDVQLYEFALKTMLDSGKFNRIYLTVPKEYVDDLKAYWSDNSYVRVIAGGSNRYESCKNAFKYTCAEFKNHPEVWVTFIDASCPLVSKNIICSVVENAISIGGGATAISFAKWVMGVVDTKNHLLTQTLSQQAACQIETPQTFALQILIDLFSNYYYANFEDLASAIIKLGKIQIATVPTTESGFRIIDSYDYVRFIDELKRAK